MRNKTVKKANQKSTEALIESLSQDLGPVKRLFSPFWVITPWLLIALAYLAGVVHFLGVRMDFTDKLSEPDFVFEMSLILSIAVTAGYCSGWLAIPDMRDKQWMFAVPVSLFGAFVLYMGAHFVTEGISFAHMHWHHCFSNALLMAFVPVALLSLLVRRGATTRPRRLAFMSTLSVGALGWGASRITCMEDNASHTFFTHFLPFILLATLLGLLARRIYRW